MNPRRPACFLDRDGVLNHLVLHPETGELDSPMGPEEMRVVDGCGKALRQAREAGYLVVVVTNQPAYAKGKTTRERLEAAQWEFERQVAAQGGQLDGVYVCLHHPTEAVVSELAGECECRKPKPGMLLRAAEDLGIDLSRSWMIGDRRTDVLAGRAAGCRTVFLAGGQDRDAQEADYRCASLQEAIEIVIREGSLL